MKVGIIHDMTETKPINLKKSIFDSIELKIKDPILGFESVEEYVHHILEKALEIQNESGKKSEDELVEEKLKQLGYI
jgi:hypothetical protein|tara:strand:- start:956 stop:1186 length:231 start_codon:yes stop_codon:yes gene_type:complete